MYAIKNNPINFQDSMAKMDCHEETVESTSIDDSQNIMNIEVSAEAEVSATSTECPLGETDEIIDETKSDSNCDESSALTRTRIYMKEFGVFRKEDFIDEISWNQFLAACKEMRKGRLLLQRKNTRLLAKIKMLKYVVRKLKEKNLITDSVTNMSYDD